MTVAGKRKWDTEHEQRRTTMGRDSLWKRKDVSQGGPQDLAWIDREGYTVNPS